MTVGIIYRPPNQVGFIDHFNNARGKLPFQSNEIKKGFKSRMILIDLKKAFDILDRDRLLDKMKYLGFTLKAIDWFGSYFKKRTIVVSLEKILSETGICKVF